MSDGAGDLFVATATPRPPASCYDPRAMRSRTLATLFVTLLVTGTSLAYRIAAAGVGAETLFSLSKVRPFHRLTRQEAGLFASERALLAQQPTRVEQDRGPLNENI